MAINWGLINPDLPAQAKTIDAFGAIEAGRNQVMAQQEQRQMGGLRALQMKAATQGLEQTNKEQQVRGIMARWLDASRSGDTATASAAIAEAKGVDPVLVQKIAAEQEKADLDRSKSKADLDAKEAEARDRNAPIMLAAIEAENQQPGAGRAILEQANLYNEQVHGPMLADRTKRATALQYIEQMPTIVSRRADEAKAKREEERAAASAASAERSARNQERQIGISEERLAFDRTKGAQQSARERDQAAYDRAVATPEVARTPSQKLHIAKMEKQAGLGALSGGATGRENIFTTRVINALSGVDASFESLRGQPSTAGTGAAGIAGGDASTFTGATSNWLKGKMNSDTQTNYNTAWAGLSRQMANAEASGLVPSGTFANAFNALQFTTADSPSERLHKLAQVRIDMDAVAASKVSDPRVSDEQKEAIRVMQQKIGTLAPFTMDEVNALGNKAIPMSDKLTVKQWVAANERRLVALGIRPKPTTARPAAPAPRPAASVQRGLHPPEIQQLIDAANN